MGVWILAIMVYTSHNQVLLLPYEKFDTRMECESWKGRESHELGLPLTCTQESNT